MADISPVSRVRDTLYGLISTFLATGTKDIVGQFTNVARDPKTGHRLFSFEGKNFFVSNRPTNGLFVAPGVNIYFGDTLAIKKKVLPQIYHMPVMIHILCPYADEPLVGEKQALRISEKVQDAFEGSGGLQQVYDFTTSPPTPMTGRFVSWAKVFRGDWKELGDPTKEDFTNRQWTTEVHYVR
jgi:hypothetical protein